MQRAFTLLSLVLGCFAALSIVYYFGFYLPRFHDAELAEQRRKTDLENGEKCHADGVKFYAQYRELSAFPAAAVTWLNGADPDTHFNRKLNTCLVETGFHQVIGGEPQGKVMVTVMVIDIYNNRRTLITGDYTFDERERPSPLSIRFPGHLDLEDYYAQKKKLFSE